MNYRKTPNARPWSRELSLGDMLTAEQAACIDRTRLADFGLSISDDNRVVREERR